MKADIKCPKCGLELPESYFLVMAFLKNDKKYWCPECGHDWKEN